MTSVRSGSERERAAALATVAPHSSHLPLLPPHPALDDRDTAPWAATGAVESLMAVAQSTDTWGGGRPGNNGETGADVGGAMIQGTTERRG